MIDRTLNYGRHHIRRFVVASPGLDVLDIGAGTGVDLRTAAEVRPEAHLQAVEVHPPYADLLEGQGVRVHRVDLEHEPLPLPSASIDVVIANQVLEHTKEIFWIFHEVSRVLRRGGHLIVGVPNLASLHNRLLLLAGRQPTTIQNQTAHVRGYTRRDLLKVVESAFPGGYALRGFGGSNFYPFGGWLARPLAALFPSAAWGIFLHLRKEREYEREFVEYPVRERLETRFFLGPERR
jgi:ubiquinone/menaquinone biosynthesis C-methylase UbiE